MPDWMEKGLMKFINGKGDATMKKKLYYKNFKQNPDDAGRYRGGLLKAAILESKKQSLPIRQICQIIFVAGLSAVGLPQPARGEDASIYANAAVRITEARKANAALMRQYTWNSRTEILDQGEVKDIRIELVNYAPDGQLTRSLLNDQSAPLPRGFLRRAIAENKKQEMEEYLKGLQGLLEQYTLPTTGKILDFMMSGKLSGPDAGGLLSMTGSNVVIPGDSLTIWTDLHTRHTRKIQVSTFYQENLVQLTATFNTIASGLNYVAYAEAVVPAKQLTVQVQNFNYSRPN
jgi:hypothetical protein